MRYRLQAKWNFVITFRFSIKNKSILFLQSNKINVFDRNSVIWCLWTIYLYIIVKNWHRKHDLWFTIWKSIILHWHLIHIYYLHIELIALHWFSWETRLFHLFAISSSSSFSDFSFPFCFFIIIFIFIMIAIVRCN